MTKSDIVNAVADGAGLSKADAGRALAAVLDTLTDAMKRGESVSLVGFGTFAVKTRAARTGRNPQSGESMDIPSSRIPSFKPGKALKDSVNE